MTRLTHHERSQNKRVLIVALICLGLLLGIAVTSRADAAHAAPATAPAVSASATYDDVPTSYKRWYGRDVCITDNSWGSFYPAVMEQIANQLDGPQWMNVSIFNGAPNICSNQLLDRQILRFGLIPAANAHLYNWCANTNSVNMYPYPGSASSYYGSHVELYWNYYASGCQSANYIKRGLAMMMAGIWGLQRGAYGTLYSCVNTSRTDILQLTANDLVMLNSFVYAP